jgi:hypothetical protein
MSSNPSYFNLPQGKSVSSLVTISRINNFNGTITLSDSWYGPSSGLTLSLNATSVTLSSTVTSATVNVTITASMTATPNSYNVYIAGTNGRLSRSTYIFVNLTPTPEFDIFPVSSSTDFDSGTQGTSTIMIVPKFGFIGNVSLTSSTSPSTGLTVTCPNRVVVTGPASINATCTIASTTPGTYHVRILATSGSLAHNATFDSHVGGFTISLITPVDFDLGSTSQAILSVTSTNRFIGNITLTGSGSGLAISCSTMTVSSPGATVPGKCTVTATAAGTYQLRVIGIASPGSLSESALAIVHVGDFTISTSSGSFNAGASGTSITVSITSTFNFAGSVSLRSTIAPGAGLAVSCPANAIPVTPNSTSTASCILSSTSPATYQITVYGTATSGTASHDATSIIHVGDFSISISPIDVNSGSSGTMLVYLTSTNNFAGPISVIGSTSAGLTVACPDAPTSIMANSTITTSCTLSSDSPGTYSVMVTGTSGTGTSTHSASVLSHIGDFVISITTPSSFSLGGPDGLITVNLTSKLNFAGTLVLNATVGPSNGLTVTCPSLKLTANATLSGTCTFSADSPGTYFVTISGNSLPGTGSHTSSGIVQVVDFTVSAGEISPSTVSAGNLGTSSITISPINGYTGKVTLAVTSTDGLSCSFDRATIQSFGTSNLSCTSSTAGDYKVTVTAIGESTFHQTSLTFHVKPAASGAATNSPPTMFGLQLPQFFGLVGTVIVAISIAGVTAIVRRKRP